MKIYLFLTLMTTKNLKHFKIFVTLKKHFETSEVSIAKIGTKLNKLEKLMRFFKIYSLPKVYIFDVNILNLHFDKQNFFKFWPF
jgi:hypothetical protein